MIWVLSGPESSGKSTLANQLSAHLGWPVFPELARQHLEHQISTTKDLEYRYKPSDLLYLLQQQLLIEQSIIQSDNVLLDTDLLTLIVWWQEKYGPLPAPFQYAWRTQQPRVHLLCQPDLPWQADPLRENPRDREHLFERYLEQLTQRGCLYGLCRGKGKNRLQSALLHIADQELIKAAVQNSGS